jgi:hypothetical protein
VLKNENHFVGERGLSIPPTSVIKTEFEGHVHARIFESLSRFAPTQVVDAVFRSTYEVCYTVQARCGVVGVLRSKPGEEAKIYYAECYRLQDRGIILIKGTIDED